MNKKNLVEALLFLKGESLTKKYIMDTVSVTEDELKTIIGELHTTFSNQSGIVILESESEIALGTNPLLAESIDTIDKKERGGELSKASLETLAVILYKNGATRSEIDYVRGVNSSFILRNLSLRGLVEKKENSKDSRSYIYAPTVDTLRFLGITAVEQLPEYTETLEKISTVFSSKNDETN
jgi:segregation and condensation protein B